MQPWVQSFVSCAHTCETAANAARTERALKIIVEDVVVTEDRRRASAMGRGTDAGSFIAIGEVYLSDDRWA